MLFSERTELLQIKQTLELLYIHKNKTKRRRLIMETRCLTGDEKYCTERIKEEKVANSLVVQ